MVDALGSLELILCASCSAAGTMICSGCNLVKYCSRDCQIAHRKVHKPICKSPLTKLSWVPSWVREGRQPTFVTQGHQLTEIFGPRKYLCGNTPAFDHLSYADLGEVREPTLLFAASGDLRNIISTLNAYDIGKLGKLKFVLNDLEEYVVVRNLLLLVLLGSQKEGVVDAAIHLWYSTSLTPAMAELIGETCSDKLGKMRKHTFQPGADNEALISTNIEISSVANARVVWPRKVWKTLFAVLDNNGKLDGSRAVVQRAKVALTPRRVDFRDRHLSWIPLHYRLARQRFFEDGQLLPFSQNRDPFTTPNFTFFDPATNGWLHQDFYNPLDGYNIQEILKTNSALPVGQKSPDNDLFGMLYLHLYKLLSKFHKKLQQVVSFTFLCTDAAQIHTLLPRIPSVPQSFDMVDVSNLTDHRAPEFGYLGVYGVLGFIGKPLLNPKGVLISSFLNYRKNFELHLQRSGIVEQGVNPYEKKAIKACTQYFDKDWMMRCLASGEHMGVFMYKFAELSREFMDYEEVWRVYSEAMDNVEDACQRTGMKIKRKEWPFRLKLEGRRDREEVIKEEEMAALNGTGPSVLYVQWVRK